MKRSVNVCVVHNNEADRLEYLRPKVTELVALLAERGIEALAYDIGPDTSGMADRVPQHTIINRAKRAQQASYMYSRFNDLDPRISFGPFRRLRKRYRKFKHLFLTYKRSVKIEQEVLFAHATCWNLAAQANGYAFILESDVLFSEESSAHLCDVVKHVDEHFPGRPIYVDLAGGCNVNDILNSWCFESGYGAKQFQIPSIHAVSFYSLPLMTTNTVAGYLINSELAKLFCSCMDAKSPVLAPDWAINAFSLQNNEVQSAVCIHSTPTLLRQGSSEGTYSSTIEARKP
jgi:hypothetical protein